MNKKQFILNNYTELNKFIIHPNPMVKLRVFWYYIKRILKGNH